MSGGFEKELGRVEVPGQQCVDPVDRVFGDAREHLAQVSLRVEPAQCGGTDQTGGAIGKGIIVNTSAHLNNIIYLNTKSKDLFIFHITIAYKILYQRLLDCQI